MTDNNRQTQWDEMHKRMSKTTDKLGKGIDAGIMDTVVVLNLLEVPTTMSCEGHLEWGTGAPWVDIGDRQTSESEEYKEFTRLMDEAKTANSQGRPSAHIFEQARAVRRIVRQKPLAIRKKLMNYLDMFYRQRDVPYDARLVLQGLGITNTRIESQGSDFQEIAPLEEKQRKLLEYQAEMQAFTAFLKEQFFQKPSQEI